jgi:secondary thiamine-phosphate synthase enzyme
MIKQFELVLPPYTRGFHLITDQIESTLELPEQGLLHLFLMHTSAGLLINESADPDVRRDLELDLERLVPERQSYYIHTLEGDDDMPAHTKAALTRTELSIPVANHRLKLGTWQGIWLCEFRNRGGSRKIAATILT